jgi:hypothetical protein
MALLLFDGFDYNASSRKWTSAAAPSYSATTRFGTGQSISFATSNSQYLQYAYGSAKTRLIFGLGFYPHSVLVGPKPFVTFYDGASQQLSLCEEADGSLSFRRGGAAGTVVGQTAAGVLQVDHWLWLEGDVTINATTGAAGLWVEGTQLINATGANTAATANNSTDSVYLGDVGGTSGNSFVDDFYLLDTSGGSPYNARLGDVRVYTVFPTADGAVTQWTPLSGANYTNVDDGATSDEDSTYVHTGTSGNKDLYAVGDLPGTFTGSVYSVAVTARMRKDDSGVRVATATVRSGATDADGASHTLFSTYDSFTDRFDLDPNGSVAWTATTVNALQAGVKLVS